MPEIRILTVPYELGRLRDGTGLGAEALLDAGAERALGCAGATVTTELVTLDDRYGTTGHGDVDAAFALIGSVAGRIRDAEADGAFPVVLGGSCFLGVGVTVGLGGSCCAVVYLDAHADFNHPESSEHGYFDGMGLAVMTGGAWQGMFAGLPGAEPVPETGVVLAGARDFDPAEEQRVSDSGIVHIEPDRLRSPDALVGALARMPSSEAGVYLHIDLDVIDRDVGAVNVYSAPGGLDGAELTELVAAVAALSPLRALSLTCYDPTFDAEGTIPPIAIGVLETVARGLGQG